MSRAPQEHAHLIEAFAIFTEARAKVEEFYKTVEARLIASRSGGGNRVMAVQSCKLIDSEIGLRLERVKARVYESCEATHSRAAPGFSESEEDVDGKNDEDASVWSSFREGDATAARAGSLLRAFAYVEVDDDS